MLSENEINGYIDNHSLADTAVQYMSDVRARDASRMVGTHSKQNLCSWIPSKKMGHTISVESRGPEKAFFLLCEYDDRVLEYWDQPEPVKVKRTDKNGKLSRGYYTPDALILGDKGPRVVEVKPLDYVEKLVADCSPDWECLPSGAYRYKPAYEVFSALGLRHEVFVYSNELAYKVANIELLLQSRDVESSCVDAEKKVEKVFQNGFFFTLDELREQGGFESCLPIIQLIDEGKLYADLNATLISSPEGCAVTRQAQTLPHALDIFGAGKIASSGKVSALGVGSMPSEMAAARALKRLKKLQSDENSRSQRRDRALIKRGKANGLSEFQALIPQYHKSGNRLPKISGVVKRTLLSYLLDDHIHKQGLSTYRSYTRYLVAARESHPAFDPVCRTTFFKEIKKIPSHKRAMTTGGRRSANAAAAPSDPLQRSLKPQMPWQVAVVDHYKADVYLVLADANGVHYVARPWVSMMLDRYSGKVLGLAVSFTDPSRRAVCKVIRDCVRRHGRLPSEIISDRGSDFKSVYYEALLAHYRITYTLRPTAHGRYGGEIEGIFGEFKRQWLCQLTGNLTNFQNARAVDGEKRPDRCAVLRPHDFISHLQRFVSWRDRKNRAVSTTSAQLKFESPGLGVHLYGREISYDEDFILATAVETQNYKVDFRRGIHIDAMWFWNPAILQVEGRKSHLEVRIDPENPHVIYTLVSKQWIPCFSSQANTYSSKDSISQLIDGLLISEGRTARRRAFEDADIEAVHKIAELDECAGVEDSVAVAWVEAASDKEESVFDALSDADIQVFRAENWGDSK